MKKIFFLFSILISLALSSSTVFAESHPITVRNPDILIKGSTNSVYYQASNGKRYVFPNQKTYNSWFVDFSDITTVTDSELANYPIGGNVTYRPGYRMVKITTDPKVYAVYKGGVLRWIPTADIAQELFGDDWANKIDDVPDTFFTNYTVGAPINSADEIDLFTVFSNTTSINNDKSISAGLNPKQATTDFIGIKGCVDCFPPPTYQNISYGPAGEYNTLDLWLVGSPGVTPLVVFIHGGGFYEGSKENINNQHYYPKQDSSLVDIFFKAGISVASINYRLTQNHPEWAYTQKWYDNNPVPAAMFDSGKAISFLRANAEEYNIDPNKIAATGFSAGGGISLWLASNDNISPLAKPNCIGPWNAQSTYDPRTIFELMPDTDLYKNFFVLTFYNINPDTFKLSQANEYDTLFREASPLTHVSAGDPPVFMYYPKVSLYNKEGTISDNIHNPIFGITASTYFDDLNIPYELYYRENPQDALISNYEATLRMRDFFLEQCFN